MAEKLSVTIALQGGKLVEQQLKDIGEAGQKAFLEISKAAQQAGGFKNLKPEDVTQKLRDMGIVGKEAFDKITSAVANATRMESIIGTVQKLETGFAGLVESAAAFGRALGPIGAVAVTAGVAITKAMSDSAEAINKIDQAAIKAGMSIEKFDGLRAVFEAMGLSAAQVASGMTAIGAAKEKANLDQVAQDFKVLQEGMTRGFGGQGTAEWQRLNEAMAGGGAAADAAKKAIIDLGGVISESATKSLPDMINKFGGDVPKAVAAFVQQLQAMPEGANRTSQAIAGLNEAGVGLVQGFRNGSISGEEFSQKLNVVGQDMAKAASQYDQANNKFFAAFERFRMTGDVSELGKMWELYSNQVSIGVSNSIQQIEALIQKIKELNATTPQAPAGGGASTPIPGNAAGGLIGGRGSGTSDSNLAWVSRGEHIMPARAVRQPGMLALLEALRRTGGNLRGVMDGMGRFALGGVVPQLPRFAEGGLVGGMGASRNLGTLTLQLSDGTTVTGLTDDRIVQALSRVAVRKRLTSTGKKPGWLGG